ncbi:MAG: YraN family protein [Candidatus Falkowbacteria bacterium]
MLRKDALGQRGEDAACLFLSKQGHEIIARNIRFSSLEIDIISRFNKQIHIIEVKTRASSLYGTASDALNQQKIKNMKKAAVLYSSQEKVSLERITLGFIAIDYIDNLANIKYYRDILG